MIKMATALLSGIIFGFGLIISQMVNPQKVLSFLDVSGDWDPSLALVMTGALLTLGLLQPIVLRRTAPLCETRFHISRIKSLDRALVVGAALFGLGWGLMGFCPGPAVLALGYKPYPALIFVVAMLFGMLLPDVFKQPDSQETLPTAVEEGD